MITVEEARQLSESVETDVMRKVGDAVNSLIKDAAKAGNRSARFDGNVSLAKLKKLLPGFAVEYHDGSSDYPGRYEKSYFTISW